MNTFTTAEVPTCVFLFQYFIARFISIEDETGAVVMSNSYFSKNSSGSRNEVWDSETMSDVWGFFILGFL